MTDRVAWFSRKFAFDLEPWRRVLYLQNHDQIANSAKGLRLHALTSPGQFRALSALTLLSPGTPMLFMGQEFAASAPFLYFADHRGDLAANVGRGRREFLAQFPSIAAMSRMCSSDTQPRCFCTIFIASTHTAWRVG